MLHVPTLVLAGQSLGELTALEQSVEQALQTGDGDPEYWEAVQKRLRIYKAKAQVSGGSRGRRRGKPSSAKGAAQKRLNIDKAKVYASGRARGNGRCRGRVRRNMSQAAGAGAGGISTWQRLGQVGVARAVKT